MRIGILEEPTYRLSPMILALSSALPREAILYIVFDEMIPMPSS